MFQQSNVVKLGSLMTSSIYPTSRYCGSKFYWIL